MSLSQNVDTGPQPPAPSAWLQVNFALTILVSAFLLFQVQPLISKFILPWFGGSPAVWTTCMLFFQVLLFGGYAYAHATARFLAPRGQGILHLVLIVLAFAALPISPNPAWKPVGSEHPTLRILALLATTVGAPYFILSSTGPLVQSWFSRTYPGRSPYRLYSLSNIGSLAALISYPFFFEPRLASGSQAMLWSIGFVAFGLMCGAIAFWVRRLPEQMPVVPRKMKLKPLGSETAEPETPKPAALPPTWLERLMWVGLPAIASLVLLATTNHVCQDVASIPLLWVIPLSLYLLTFIIAFDHERWYLPGIFGVSAGLLLFLVGGLKDLSLPSWMALWVANFKVELALYFVAMFLACMICHGQLVRIRPRAEHLTEYYLLISAGGALGGIFVSLIAPHIFTTFLEFRIGLVLAYALALAVVGFRVSSAIKGEVAAQWVTRIGAALVAIVGSGYLIGWEVGREAPLYRARNFYGTVAVRDYNKDEENHSRIFVSGRIQHGVQYMNEPKRSQAISYFGEASGVGRALLHASQHTDTRVGVVGLGIGASAVYARPGHYYRFYEINPEVEKIATDYFYYLKDCKGRYEIVLGDARLALEREEPQNFDVICLDAFSGDAVPTHLLTKEAFGVYLRHLKKRDEKGQGRDGILVVNITNTYVNLVPVVKKLAEYHEMPWIRVQLRPDRTQADQADQYTTDYILLTRDAEFIKANAPTPEEVEANHRPGDDRNVPLWTDDYSNLLQIME